MNNTGTLIFLFAILLVFVAILATVVGYFWASSTAKSTLLVQIKEQRDEAFKQAQEQFQGWKQQELDSIRHQTFDAAKGQVIQEMQEQVRNWQQNELQTIKKQLSEALRGEAIQEAQTQLVKWRNEDLENAKHQIWEAVIREAAFNLEQWKVEVEKEIRQDAIDKSQSVTMGKMTEHMVPYLPGFGFNPSDARFIGSPIDLIVFDGLGNDCVNKIVFIEIKTGVSTLSTRERLVRDAILAGKVEWMEVKANLNGPGIVQKVKSRRNLSV
jgi:predicted Holliday junction resolvase-like endonuclease